MTYSGLDKNGVLVANKVVVNGNEEECPALKPHYRDFLERFIVLEAGQRVGINDVEILALKTKHSEQEGVGFKFFTSYFTLSYSGDTKYFPELIEQYKNSNILILNVPHLKKEDAKDNLCIEDAIKIIKEVAPRLAIIQHFGIEMVKGDTLYQIREIQKATGVQTVAAKDGMVVNPLSYSVDQGQRTLHFSRSEKKAEITGPPKEPQQQETIEEEHQSIIGTEQTQKVNEIIKKPQTTTKEPPKEPQQQEPREIIEEPEQEHTKESPQEEPQQQEPLEQTTETSEQIEQKKILESTQPIKDILRED